MTIDDKAFEKELVSIHNKMGNAARQFSAKIRNALPADDLLQDTLIRMWEKRANFDPEKGPLFSWGFAVMRSVFYDQARRHNAKNGRLHSIFDKNARKDPYDVIPGHAATPEEHLQCMETLGQIVEAGRNMPRRQRQVLAGRLEGQPPEAIAEDFGIPARAVYKHTCIFRQTLIKQGIAPPHLLPHAGTPKTP